MVTLMGHRQTKGAATDKQTLRPPRLISTLHGQLTQPPARYRARPSASTAAELGR